MLKSQKKIDAKRIEIITTTTETSSKGSKNIILDLAKQ